MLFIWICFTYKIFLNSIRMSLHTKDTFIYFASQKTCEDNMNILFYISFTILYKAIATIINMLKFTFIFHKEYTIINAYALCKSFTYSIYLYACTEIHMFLCWTTVLNICLFMGRVHLLKYIPFITIYYSNIVSWVCVCLCVCSATSMHNLHVYIQLLKVTHVPLLFE